MNQKVNKIYKFKKGDIITKLLPIIDHREDFKDYGLVGKKVTFLGIANASIYLSRESDFFTKMFSGMDRSTIQLPLDLWEDGWGYYIEPNFLEDKSPIIEDEGHLMRQIEQASGSDNFELANILKKRLEALQKEKENKKKNKKNGDKK